MKTRFAFIGFRHPHVWDAVRRVAERSDCQIVASCEEDEASRKAITAEGKAKITHTDYRRLLAEVDCDAVIVGDAFGRRGGIVVDALAAGRHVLSDKPACTTLADLEGIEAAARRSGKVLGMMLELRDLGAFRCVHRLVRAGEIGEVRAISFGGQHPLLVGTRPGWYHEDGAHGGAINDIAIHGIDFARWATGLRFTRVVAARCWKRGVPEHSHFRNAGQLMLTMENDCGVVADVSYFSPDAMGYTMPQYWRFTMWGSEGVLEAGVNAPTVTLFRAGSKEPTSVPADPPAPGGYLDSFLREVRGELAKSDAGTLCARDVFAASRISLVAQDAADKGLYDLAL